MEKWIRARFLPGLPLGKDGRRVTAGKEHIALSRRAAREGMVLLKNEGNVLPLQPGCKAASMIRGIQSNRIAATPKHFALNNKETNRRNCDSRASERAIREIYLKQFEILVRESHPWSIMSGYNIVNGHRASENRDLLTSILREEWGFDGMVTTDWWTLGEHYKEAAAGNDMKIATGYPDRLLAAVEKGVLTREDMEKAAFNILQLILRVD